jgi:hypothetical protein
MKNIFSANFIKDTNVNTISFKFDQT